MKIIVTILVLSLSSAHLTAYFPLHDAALRGANNIVDSLISKNMSPLAPDDKKNLPIHYAAQSDIGLQSLKILVREGTPLNVRNAQGDTPLTIAIKFNNNITAAWLIAHGAEYDHTDPATLRFIEKVFPGYIAALLDGNSESLIRFIARKPYATLDIDYRELIHLAVIIAAAKYSNDTLDRLLACSATRLPQQIVQEALEAAVLNGNIEGIHLLLPLVNASYARSCVFLLAIYHLQVDVLKILYAMGIDHIEANIALNKLDNFPQLKNPKLIQQARNIITPVHTFPIRIPLQLPAQSLSRDLPQHSIPTSAFIAAAGVLAIITTLVYWHHS